MVVKLFFSFASFIIFLLLLGVHKNIIILGRVYEHAWLETVVYTTRTIHLRKGLIRMHKKEKEEEGAKCSWKSWEQLRKKYKWKFVFESEVLLYENKCINKVFLSFHCFSFVLGAFSGKYLKWVKLSCFYHRRRS